MLLVSFEEGNQIEKHKSSGETCVWTEKKVKQNNTFLIQMKKKILYSLK